MTNNLLIAISITISGGLIGGAVLMSNNKTDNPPFAQAYTESTNQAFRDIQENDFVYGKRNAQLTIVEYSDYECPFCARLHKSLKELVDSRPSDVNWVFRDFPVHKEAWNTSYAATCIGKISGNDAFWDFSNIMFENQGSLDSKLYIETAKQFGITANQLESCMNSSETQKIVTDNFEEAQRAGARGTPYSILINTNGQLSPLSGALPITTLNTVINQALE